MHGAVCFDLPLAIQSPYQQQPVRRHGRLLTVRVMMGNVSLHWVCWCRARVTDHDGDEGVRRLIAFGRDLELGDNHALMTESSEQVTCRAHVSDGSRGGSY